MSQGTVRFGGVIFDAGRGRRLHAGRSGELDRPTSAILRTLVAEAGTDVHKDRLLDAGWPGRVVHENSLAKAVSRLRHALGADGKALKTAHGYGYRLAAEPLPADWPPSAAAAGLRSRLVVAVALIAAVMLVWLATPQPAGSQAGERPLAKGEAADAIGRVLWVDDHPENNLVEREVLERRKIAVYQVTTTEEALQLLAMYEYDAVISDMNRNDKPLDGITLVREMRRRGDDTPFVLYSVVPSEAQRRLVGEAGGQAATVERGELYRAIGALVRERPA